MLVVMIVTLLNFVLTVPDLQNGATCKVSVTTINGKKTCVGETIFQDDFDTIIDSDKWVIEHRIPTYVEPDYEFNSYQNNDQVCYVKNRVLFLKPKAHQDIQEVRGVLDLRNGCTASDPQECLLRDVSSFILPPVVSGKIRSRVSFKYGKIDVKARLPSGDWIIPILGLQLKNTSSKSDSPRIWIAYSRGNDVLEGNGTDDYGSKTLLAGPVLHTAEPGRSQHLIRRSSKLPYSDEFHLYSLEWKPGKLSFYMDSIYYGEVPLDNPSLSNPFDQEYVLTLGVAVGGLYDFPDGFNSLNDPKPWINGERKSVYKFFQARNTWSKTWIEDKPALMVDYVKVTASDVQSGATCKVSVTTMNGKNTCVGEMIFQDYFDTVIESDKWVIEHRIPTYVGPDYEFNSYQNSDQVCYVKNGVLVLKPKTHQDIEEVHGVLDLRNGCTASDPQECFHRHVSSFILPPVVSGKIRSRASFKYGKIDVRARLPSGDWIIPILGLQLKDTSNKTDSPRIWIAYSRGNDVLKGNGSDDYGSRTLSAGPVLHTAEPGRSQHLISQSSKMPYSDEFHMYSLIWKPGKLTFYKNSIYYGEVPLDNPSLSNPFDQEYVLTLGVAVGGHYDFPDGFNSLNDPKPWINGERKSVYKFFQARNTWSKTWIEDKPALMVDYVKVTASDESGGQGNQGNEEHGQDHKGNKNIDQDNDKDNSRETDRTTQTPATAIPVSTCKPSPTLVKGKSSCKGKLIFEDTFKELSPDKWQPEVKFAEDPDYEFVVYQNHPENLYVSGNKLVVKPIPTEERYGAGFVTQDKGLHLGDQCTGVPESLECVQKPQYWVILPPVISAQITTRDHFSFVYGTVEIRAKLPQGDWIYPEIYLKPAIDAYGSGLDSGLIRIAFSPGNNQLNQKLSGGCILGSSVVARNFGLKSVQSRNGWNDDFHIFRMEWKTDSITLSVDDHLYGTIYPPGGGFASEEKQLELEDGVAERWRRGGAFAPFDKEMYIALGVGAGGQNFLDRADGTKPWENDDPKAQLQFYKAQNNWKTTWGGNSTLEVDYVKVWAL